MTDIKEFNNLWSLRFEAWDLHIVPVEFGLNLGVYQGLVLETRILNFSQIIAAVLKLRLKLGDTKMCLWGKTLAFTNVRHEEPIFW